jgi:hypothetical protein
MHSAQQLSEDANSGSPRPNGRRRPPVEQLNTKFMVISRWMFSVIHATHGVGVSDTEQQVDASFHLPRRVA